MFRELIAPRAETGANDVFLSRAKAVKQTGPLSNRVRMLDFEPKNKPFLIGRPDLYPAETGELLAAWPAIQQMADETVVALYPCLDPRPGRLIPGAIGGCYGCKDSKIENFGHIYASTPNALAFAEAIVVSMANWRLYALGIDWEFWSDEFLTCNTEKIHAFPIRPHEYVNSGGLIHTAYCSMMALAWYQHLMNLPSIPYGVLYSARQFHQRVARGVDGIEGMLVGASRATPRGEDLLSGLAQWGRKLLELTPPPKGL